MHFGGKLCAARRSSCLRAPSPRGSVTGRPLAPGACPPLHAGVAVLEHVKQSPSWPFKSPPVQAS
eukprot:SM000113S24040  [mRNA]  locus=s113:50197:50588:+ [translate_table: standard]